MTYHLYTEAADMRKDIDGFCDILRSMGEDPTRRDHVYLFFQRNLKNSMNIGSEEAALDNAFMYSLIESCRMNQLSPVDYLRHLTTTSWTPR